MAFCLGILEEEGSNKARVSLIYNNEPPEEVRANYDVVLETEVPPRPSMEGKKVVLYIDSGTGEVSYEYEDRELTEEEKNRKEISWLSKISTRQQVLEGLLSEEELVKLGEMYPDWEIGVDYETDDVVSYHNELYKVLQGHTSQEDWSPDETASLYEKVAPEGVVAEWSQPTGAHDAYAMGEQVSHNGSVWESEIEANTYEPGVYGWVEV